MTKSDRLKEIICNFGYSHLIRIHISMFGRIRSSVYTFKRDLKKDIRYLKRRWLHFDRATKLLVFLSAIGVLGLPIYESIYIINLNKEKKALCFNHEYCYAYVFRKIRLRPGRSLIYIRYNIENNCYEAALYPKAHVGDTILIMYNPDKPSSCLPVKYNKNKFVTKKMVDVQMYKIDPGLIRYQ